MPKIIVVLGPTASGKSKLAVKIAKSLPVNQRGEIISADSRQVYRGLNLASGKVKGEWSHFVQEASRDEFLYKNIRHHLIDFVPLKKVYTASDFKNDAEKVMADILARGKTPIICGGTGLYINAVLGKISIPTVPPNPALRKKLAKKTVQELFAILLKLDPRRAKNIDKHNPARLVRAVEIAKAIGKSPAIFKNTGEQKDVLMVGLNLSVEILKEKIHKRLLQRIKEGMVEEIRALHRQKNLTWKRAGELGLECRYIALFLQDKISRDEMLTILEKESWQYAKRQMTWFKREKNIKWINPEDKSEVKTFIKNIKNVLFGEKGV